MSDPSDRLRANLRAAGVPATDEDIAGIEAKGFLSRLAEIEAIFDATPGEQLPDYLDAASLPAPEAPRLRGSAEPPLADPDTILGAAAAIRAGATSPTALVAEAIARIAADDARLNVFQIVTAEQAMAEARRLEAELAQGVDRGPLHGVPVAVKDLFDVEGLPTAAGSKIRAGVMASEDATVVARLRAAGAVIVGKTRMSEFAYSPGSNNGHYGPTGNPFDPSRDTGGSSSGSGAATAAGMALGALGSDTGGSIRIPAAHCGLVGLKPTFGRASLAGAVTLSWSLDHPGPLARSVADAAALLEAIAGPDPRDGRTLRPAPDFSAAGITGGVRGLRVGLLRDDGSGQQLAGDAARDGLRQAAQALADAGAEVSELDVPEIDALRLLNGALIAMEAGALHLPWLRTRLDDYGPFMRQRVLSAFIYEPDAFVRAQQARARLRRRCDALFASIDLLALPCVPDVAPELDTPTPTFFTGPFNCLGWPAVSVPVGLSAAGLPVAAQLVAAPWDERTLLRAAYVVERTLGRVILSS
jgi:Asp-tRNA(Asn)/Glu-tRNA(Gln) amidotransferase A subunit family amidase